MYENHYTYRLTWSSEDHEYVALCAEFPSLSWLEPTPQEALAGMQELIRDVVADMRAHGESPPEPLASCGSTPSGPNRP